MDEEKEVKIPTMKCGVVVVSRGKFVSHEDVEKYIEKVRNTQVQLIQSYITESVSPVDFYSDLSKAEIRKRLKHEKNPMEIQKLNRLLCGGKKKK